MARKIEDRMLYCGCLGFGTTVLEIKNTMMVIVLIFLKHNGLCGQAMRSSQL